VSSFSVDAATITGMMFAISRVSGLVLGAPLIARRIPAVGRAGLAISLGLFFATPVGGSAGLDVPSLVGGIFMNLGIGLLLGFSAGLVFELFAVAGGVLDISSGLGLSSVLDPTTGSRVTVFQRLFDLTALTIFFILGGPRLLVAGLGGTLEVVPLDGSVRLDPGVANVVLDTVERFFVAGLEVAMPALAALFLTEVTLGVAARMMPQANIFLIGLPAKLLVVMATSGVVLLSFPPVMASLMTEIQRIMLAVTGALG